MKKSSAFCFELGFVLSDRVSKMIWCWMEWRVRTLFASGNILILPPSVLYRLIKHFSFHLRQVFSLKNCVLKKVPSLIFNTASLDSIWLDDHGFAGKKISWAKKGSFDVRSKKQRRLWWRRERSQLGSNRQPLEDWESWKNLRKTH